MLRLLKNIKIATETLRIIARGAYSVEGTAIRLPNADYGEAMVFGAADVGEWVAAGAARETSSGCAVEVLNADAFDVACGKNKAVVLNFANAHCPGGGFRLGASSQEESLCRRSTLYASLRSPAAARMYHANNFHPSRLESDLAILSPSVCVFRDADGGLLRAPYTVAVLSMPAPNLRGFGFLSTRARVKAGLLAKMNVLLPVAAHFGSKSLVLGAWGCGAFGNDPNLVAECFHTVLYGGGWVRHFERVVFAIKGRPGGANFSAFHKMFATGVHYTEQNS